jgi:hypothetical protein
MNDEYEYDLVELFSEENDAMMLNEGLEMMEDDDDA